MHFRIFYQHRNDHHSKQQAIEEENFIKVSFKVFQKVEIFGITLDSQTKVPQ